jgi:hypothetical protein
MVDPDDFGDEIPVPQSMVDLPDDGRSASEPFKRWEPSFSDFIAIGAITAAVILWLEPPGWKIGLPFALCTIGLFIFAGVRHRGPKIKRLALTSIAIAIFGLCVGPPMWKNFREAPPQEVSLSQPDSPNTAIVHRFPAPADLCSGAAEDWKHAASVGTREAYADHMVRFPSCPFVALARGNIEALDRKEAERWEQERMELKKQEAVRKKLEEEQAALKEAQRKEEARKQAEQEKIARKEKEQEEAARKKAEEQETARREAEKRKEATASQSIQQPQPFELPYATHPYQLPYSTDYVPRQIPPPPVPCPDPRGLPCIPR